VRLPFDEQRGLESGTDLFSPGYFRTELGGGKTAMLRAEVAEKLRSAADIDGEVLHIDATEKPFADALHAALAHFVVKRDSHRTVIAGYPWFLDWGRDTLIALRGLIAAGEYEHCRDILVEFASFERDGTLPNMIRGADDTNRDTSDAPLWLFTAVKDFVESSGDSAILEEDCGGRSLVDVLASIAEHYGHGTPNGIRVDPASGLVFSPSHFTWMDTDHPAGTPREGYPVEIQALWIAALAFLADTTDGADWASMRDRARESLESLFVHPDRRYLSDCRHAPPGCPAADARADDANRPNQLLTITLGALCDRATRQHVLDACAGLLVPGGIRSLDARPVQVELPVRRHGQLLNDPHNPYWGTYAGDEDTRRKPAYHNGTAWTWPFPLYSEALFRTYGAEAVPPALALLRSSIPMMERGCLGHIAEILDGDAPHALRGCGAQAWGVSELLRVNKLLTEALEQVGADSAQI
jgi:predicted glycogen debranching enzyme